MRLRRRRTHCGGRLDSGAPVVQLLERNLYLVGRLELACADDANECGCARNGDGFGCGASCLNRLMNVECDARVCGCGPGCLNQRLQRRQWQHVEVRPVAGKGYGLFTVGLLPRGIFILEYAGEVLSDEQYAVRRTGARTDEPCYAMTYRNGTVIDAARRGSLARFANHSCEPNCETQKWDALGELRIGIFALREISAGEELTFDYKFDCRGDAAVRCCCGAPGCRGWIGGASAACDVRDDGAPPPTASTIEAAVPRLLPSDGVEHDEFDAAELREMRRTALAAAELSFEMHRGGNARRSGACVVLSLAHTIGAEIEAELKNVLDASGAITSYFAVKRVMFAFRYVFFDCSADPYGCNSSAPGVAQMRVRVRLLSLLLEAVLRTRSAAMKSALVNEHCLAIFDSLLRRLMQGVADGDVYMRPMLLKVMRALASLPLEGLPALDFCMNTDGWTLLELLNKLLYCKSASGVPDAAVRAGALGVLEHAAAWQPPFQSLLHHIARGVLGVGDPYVARAVPLPLPQPPPQLPWAPSAPPPSPPPFQQPVSSQLPLHMGVLSPVGSPTRGAPNDELLPLDEAQLLSEAQHTYVYPAEQLQLRRVFPLATRVLAPSGAEMEQMPSSWSDVDSASFAHDVLKLVAYQLRVYAQTKYATSPVVTQFTDDMVLELADIVVSSIRRRAERSSAPPMVLFGKLRERIQRMLSAYVQPTAEAS